MTNANFQITLNQHGEVADFVNESQFEGGESAFECVAFSAAICKYAGQPGHGPTGTGEQVDQLADYWYVNLEGNNAASNTNGMSSQDEYTMLQGMNLGHHPIAITGENAHDVASVKAWLRYGFPVMICGAESGIFDMDMGDVVPYSWTPTGNHCVVASGIAPDGNLLVRDTASIAPNGVRPGPRCYDAGKLELVSATAIAMPWLPAVPADFAPTSVFVSRCQKSLALLPELLPLVQYGTGILDCSGMERVFPICGFARGVGAACKSLDTLSPVFSCIADIR
jgi:hypothetical protein